MRKRAVRCCGEKDGRTCGNILGYISEGRLVCMRHGRTVEIETDADGKVYITCEKCGQRTLIETKYSWKVKNSRKKQKNF